MKIKPTKSMKIAACVPNPIISQPSSPDANKRFSDIATAAYFKAEARDFRPGRQLDDWLEAESELLK